MDVRWLADVRADDLDVVGGKGASLGELTAADLPVPGGFVVTAGAYRSFLEATGVDEDLREVVDVDVDDHEALAEAADSAQELILEAPFPDDLRADILGAYDELGATVDSDGGDRDDDVEDASEGESEHDESEQDDPFVAVRSSATAEDQPDASFAGQQETFLNVTGEDLIDRVRGCWASLFTQRALYYRREQGYPAADVDIAVVVQRMIDADQSGVLFTSHPSSGDHRAIVEAAWGLGEAVVAGEVAPDNYVLNRRTKEVDEVTVADKRVQYVKDPETGRTVEEAVPEDMREARVLSDDQLEALGTVADRVEDHYGTPQDVEWAIVEDGSEATGSLDGDGWTLSVLQSRPITTIADGPEAESDLLTDATATDQERAATEGDGTSAGDRESGSSTVGADAESTADGSGTQVAGAEPIVRGLGASPGTAAGPARCVENLDELDKVEEGDVIVTEMTTPDMVPAMQRAVAIVTDEGGMTSHASIVSRELGVPAVVGTGSATTAIEDGTPITVDGETGRVTEGADADDGASASTGAADSSADAGAVADEHATAETGIPATATEVKVNVSVPQAAERAAATGADGVGLLRMEQVVLSLGATPDHYIGEHGEDAYVDQLVEEVRTVADAFYPRPVRVRTLDAPTDEFRSQTGGEDEPVEHNPMLGYRGIRRSLDSPVPFRAELRVIAKCHDLGYDNLEVMFPLVTDADDVRAAREHLAAAGIDPDDGTWGVMVETPASALCVEGMIHEGVDFVSFGTNDLTQYTLAVDRNNERVADRFDELHPAVLELIGDVIETCREHDVDTSICGQAGSKPEMVRFLVDAGISSISANVDAVADVQREVERMEQRLLLESVREERGV